MKCPYCKEYFNPAEIKRQRKAVTVATQKNVALAQVHSIRWIDALAGSVILLQRAMDGAAEAKEDFTRDEIGQHLKQLEWLYQHKKSASIAGDQVLAREPAPQREEL